MTNYNPGDIVLAPFPFSDLKTKKLRPVLVLANIVFDKKRRLYPVAMVTSQIDSGFIEGDTLLEDWEKPGLLYPSKARLGKLVTIEHEIIVKKIGTLSSNDSIKVSRSLKKIFQSWL